MASVAGVSARDVDEGASGFVEAGVVVAGAGAKLPPELGAAAAAAGWDEARDGEPKEKPTLPALGEGVPSAPAPAATPNTNGEGVAVDVAEPNPPPPPPPPPKGEEDDGLAGEPNVVVAPNTLLGGDAALLSFSFSLSVDLAPNILPELVVVVVVLVSPKSFVPGGMLSVNGAAPNADEPGLLSSFPSTVDGDDDDLSGPKSADDFGGLPNSEVPELGGLLLLLPKGEALEAVPADADAPNENAGFDGRAESASLGVRNTGGLKAGDAVNAPNGDVDATGAGLVSGCADGNLKGEEPATDGAGLGVKPVPSAGAAEFAVADGAGNPAKLDVAEVEVVDLPNENGVAELTGLLAFRDVD